MIITIALAITASYLFCEETLGINTFIFSMISCAYILLRRSETPINKRIIFILPTLITSTIIAIYPQTISIIVWYISYLSMWTISSSELKTLLIPLQGIISIIERLLTEIKFCQIERKRLKSQNSLKLTSPIYIIPAIIILCFSFLYIQSNPLLSDFFTNLNFSFINYNYIVSTLLFFLLLLGLVYFKKNEMIKTLNLLPTKLIISTITQKEEDEFKIAKISLWAVSIILSMVNFIDLTVLVSQNLPDNLTYSEYVHQGFYTLIFTISLAIGMIIYFYRNQLNFHHQISQLRKASYFWISQNLLLALFTCYKNMLYVEVYGLTYKRIAVFICLICTVIGLILSFQKVKSPSSNWQYFNRLAFYAFISAVVLTVIPFDKTITFYNLNYSETKDIPYLLSLKNPDYLMIYKTKNIKLNRYCTTILETRMTEIETESKKMNWQSWNYTTHKYLTNR